MDIQVNFDDNTYTFSSTIILKKTLKSQNVLVSGQGFNERNPHEEMMKRRNH